MTLETTARYRSFGGESSVLRHDSEVCATPMQFAVFQPPAALAGEPCPVLLYLSGLTCSEQNALTKAGAQRLAAELSLIVVFPDTSPRETALPGEEDAWDFGRGAGFYVDATEPPWADHYRMFSYVNQELPALVDQHFPTRGADRWAITGHSMGGHGALVSALREPGRYRSASAFAPICAPTRCPWGEKAFSGYLGADRERWRSYDACELLAGGARLEAPILVDQGQADGFLAEQLKPEALEAACEEAGQALTLRRHEGYDHSYYFIATFMEDHLRHHARYLMG